MGLIQLIVIFAISALYCCNATGNQKAVPQAFYPPCPYPHPDNVTVYFPDLCDCNKYFMCYDGAAYEEECPTSLWWDEKLEECVYPSPAVCTPNSHPSCQAQVCDLADPPKEDPSNPCGFLMCVPIPTGGGNYYLPVDCRPGTCFDTVVRRCM